MHAPQGFHIAYKNYLQSYSNHIYDGLTSGKIKIRIKGRGGSSVIEHRRQARTSVYLVLLSLEFDFKFLNRDTQSVGCSLPWVPSQMIQHPGWRGQIRLAA